MAKVNELYGRKAQEWENFSLPMNAKCPFHGQICDGGGNRDMASLKLVDDPGIRSRFSSEVVKQGSVACAICSVKSDEKDWAICPRRLLSFSESGVPGKHETLVKTLCRLASFRKGSTVAVWNEIRIGAGKGKNRFQYRFDYILREMIGEN